MGIYSDELLVATLQKGLDFIIIIIIIIIIMVIIIITIISISSSTIFTLIFCSSH